MPHQGNRFEIDPPPPRARGGDPSFQAERGLRARETTDLIHDTRRQRKRGRQDLGTQLRDLRVQERRGTRDLRRGKIRGLRGVRQEREDVRTEAGRGRQDLQTALGNLIQDFTRLGQSQTQAANVAGVLGGGTAAASAAARAENFQRERQPILTAGQRLEEDLATNLGRLGIAGREIRQDFRTGRGRLQQDVKFDTRLARRDFSRLLQDLRRQRKRAVRELEIGDPELVQQAIFAQEQLNRFFE